MTTRRLRKLLMGIGMDKNSADQVIKEFKSTGMSNEDIAKYYILDIQLDNCAERFNGKYGYMSTMYIRTDNNEYPVEDNMFSVLKDCFMVFRYTKYCLRRFEVNKYVGVIARAINVLNYVYHHIDLTDVKYVDKLVGKSILSLYDESCKGPEKEEI